MMQAFMSGGCDRHQVHSPAGVPGWVNQALVSSGGLPLGLAVPKAEAKHCKSYPPAGATNNRAGGKSCSEALMRFAKQSEMQGQQQKSIQALSSAITALQQSPAALASLVSAANPAPQPAHGWITDMPLNPLDNMSMDPNMLMFQQSLSSQLPLQYQPLASPTQHAFPPLGQQHVSQENALLAAALSAPLQGVPMQPVSRGMAELFSMTNSMSMGPSAPTGGSMPSQQLPLNQLNLALLQQSLGAGPSSPSLGLPSLPSPGVIASASMAAPQISTQNLRNNYLRTQAGLSGGFRPTPGPNSHNPILAAAVGQDHMMPASPTHLASPTVSPGRARSPRELNSSAPEPGTFRHHALQEIGTSLARTGISVQQAVQAGLLGGMCAAEVKILCEAHERVWKQTHSQLEDWPSDPSNASDSSALPAVMFGEVAAGLGQGSCKQEQLNEFSLFGGQTFSSMAASKDCDNLAMSGFLDCVGSM